MRKRGALAPVCTAAVLTLVALLAGCASAPKQVSHPSVSQGAQPAATRPQNPLDAARAALDDATPPSLKRAADTLSSSDLAGSTDAAPLAAVGKALSLRLFPEVPSPFADAVTPADEAALGITPFLSAVGPCLVLLDSTAAPPSQDQAAALSSDLTAADGKKSGSALVAYLQAMLLERTGADPSKALAGYEESFRRSADFYPAAARVAEILIAEGRAPQELDRLLSFAAAMPTDGLRYALTARAQLAAGHPQEAADAAARAMIAEPDDPSPALLRAQALEASGNWYQALYVLNALLAFKPDLPDALLTRIQILHTDARDDAQANDALQKAMGTYPRDMRFVELQGQIYLDQGDPDQAVVVLKKAVQSDPQNVTVLALLAEAAAEQGAWQDAEQWFSQIPAAQLTPDRLRLGWRISTAVGKHDRALAFAQQLVAIGASDEPLLLQARSLASLGRAADTLQAVSTGLAQAKDPRIRSLLLVVKASVETPASDQAIDDLRTALREDPDDTEALTAVAAAFRNRQDYRKALDYLRHAAELSPNDASLARSVQDLEGLVGNQD